MTESIRNLVEPGSTMPQTLLMSVSNKPRANRARRGRTSSITSGHALRSVSPVFFLAPGGIDFMVLRTGDTSFRVHCARRARLWWGILSAARIFRGPACLVAPSLLEAARQQGGHFGGRGHEEHFKSGGASAG